MGRKKGNGKRKSIPRKRIPFELEMNKPEHLDLLAHITLLKRDRMFRKTIINGLNLMRDLTRRKTEVLFSLFPFIKDMIETEIQNRVIEEIKKFGGGNNQGGDIKQLVNDMKLIKQMITTNTPPPVLHAAPIEELPDFEVKVTKSDKIPSYESMISGVKLSGKFHKLPPEVARYAVKMGRLEASQLPQLQEEKKEEILPVIAAQEITPKANRFSFNRK